MSKINLIIEAPIIREPMSNSQRFGNRYTNRRGGYLALPNNIRVLIDGKTWLIT